jgi:glucose/arabinose dehydrogenase
VTRLPVLRTLLAAVLLVPAPAAYGAAHTIVSAGNLYAPADITVARGDTVELVNVDPVPHNITALSTSASGALLFSSDNADAGERVTVRGVEKLKPGAYAYFCSLHEEMRGTIRVADQAPSPVPAAPGWVATPTVGTVPSPTSLTLFQDALYVASYARGDVTKLPVLTGGLLGVPSTYASGFDQPLGVVFAPDGSMYVADSRAAGTGRVGRVWHVTSGGTAKTAVLDGLPNGRHATNGLAVWNGRLYVAQGNNTDDGTGVPPEQPLSGTILSIPLGPRAQPLTPGAKAITVEARGLRNPYDVTFRPGTPEIWFATNGPDAQDPYGEDLLHKVDVRGPAADYGFPACVYKAGPTPSPKCSAKHRRPETAFGLHVSANGLAFGPKTAPWNGDLFVAEYGNNPGETNAGHKVVRVPMSGGRAGAPQDVLSLPSPLDVAFGPSGTGLYVADFGSGQILLVRPEG